MTTPIEPSYHPWFRPLYRRVLVLLVCVGWLAFEITQQDPFWLLMAGAATGYAVWDFFLRDFIRMHRSPS